MSHSHQNPGSKNIPSPSMWSKHGDVCFWRGGRWALCICRVFGLQMIFESRRTSVVTHFMSTVRADYFCPNNRTIWQCFESKFAIHNRVGQIDPKIDSIDTKVNIGIGSILAWWDRCFCYSFTSINSVNHMYFFTEFVWAQRLSQSLSAVFLFTSLTPLTEVHCNCNTKIYTCI